MSGAVHHFNSCVLAASSLSWNVYSAARTFTKKKCSQRRTCSVPHVTISSPSQTSGPIFYLSQFFSKFSLRGDRERFTRYQPATQRDPEIAPHPSIEGGHAPEQNFSGIVKYQCARTFTNWGIQTNLPSAFSRNLIRVTDPIALGIQVIQSLWQRIAKGHPLMVTIDDSQFNHGGLNREHA